MTTYQSPSGKTREELHRHYAGELYLSDFNGKHSPGNIANRILQAEQFDKTCQVNDWIRHHGRDSI